jgi:DHA1 family tetracycline resistance protein-like MFS transporter
MAVGIVSVIVSGGVVRPTVRRLGERKAVYFGYLTGALGFAMYAIAPTGALLFVGVPFAGLWSVSGPALQALMSREMPADEQGQLQGALSSLRGIADMIGPLLFTRVMMAGAETTGSPAGAGAPFLLSAVLLGLGCLLLGRVRPSPSSAGQTEGDPIAPRIT